MLFTLLPVILWMTKGLFFSLIRLTFLPKFMRTQLFETAHLNIAGIKHGCANFQKARYT